MPKGLDACCDTSVLIPALLAWHENHDVARTALTTGQVAVPAHAIVETFSAVTRMPAHLRLAPTVIYELLADLAERVEVLVAPDVVPILGASARQGIAGGATYDALIGATAKAHGLVLLTMDRRAGATYEAVGVDVRFLA